MGSRRAEEAVRCRSPEFKSQHCCLAAISVALGKSLTLKETCFLYCKMTPISSGPCEDSLRSA